MTPWFRDLYRQAEPAIALVLGAMRKDGVSPDDFVFVVADTRDDAGRFFVDQLLPQPLGLEIPGYVGAAKKADVARVLRVVDAGPQAESAEEDTAPGLLRVLVVARGVMQCADVPLEHTLTRGGES